ncbi:serine/threonine protein kinase [Pseudenhygromyxa sp. WMMC2535]|uniref:serine/threonine-protein kinase n=1 Tax=Pseudenhygromyxa sp. WMMC2535 TaxID=2712867 RepID=UPI0015516FF6|nr:serine/threonine-protein kinase [Pseudenhygromyxa sp. WMMC2535]NVB36855.1 serine/threonine protein kinase [Pseudenhygromyxa sp. WMMC2535]
MTALDERLSELGLDEATLTLAEAFVAREGKLVLEREAPAETLGEGDERGEGEGDTGGPESTGVLALPRLLGDGDGDGDGELVLERTIGSGGMAKVWSARQQSLGRRVAVKQLRAERRNAKSRAALLREARLAGSLEHPNIVPIHTLGRSDEGWPVLVMKFIEGTPWKRALEPLYVEGRDPDPGQVERALRVFMAVCTAVDYAHSHGVIHRDLKPDNVMLGAFEEVYLVDWGLALELGPRGHARPEDVIGLEGTPGYMAPEMVASEAERIGPWTDVYLLGAMLHEVLLGARRHVGESITETLLASHESSAHDYPSWVPEELAEICNRATQREHELRFASAAGLRDAVGDFLQHRAAVDLSEAARQSFARLRRETLEPARFAQLAAEARFGLRQALREWPENARARRDLCALLEFLLERELGLGNAQAAASYLGQLQDEAEREARGEVPSEADEAIEISGGRPGYANRLADYESRLEQLRARQAAREHDAEALEALRRDASLVVNVALRRRLTMINASILALGAGLLFSVRYFGIYEPSYAAMIVLTGLLTLVTGIGSRFIDRREGNLANRQLMASITAGCAGVVLLFSVAWIGKLDLIATQAMAMVIAATISGVMGATLDRRMLWTGIGFVLAAVLICLVPDLRGLWVSIFGGSSFLLGSALWRRMNSSARIGGVSA